MYISQATIDDIESLVPLFDAYRMFYKQDSNCAEVRKFILARFQYSDSVFFIAKTDDEKVIGFTQLYPLLSSISLQRIWILNDLFVNSEHRKLGTGEKLIKEAVHFAKASGARKLTLQTALDNYPAQKLYERLGWVKENYYLTYNLPL